MLLTRVCHFRKLAKLGWQFLSSESPVPLAIQKCHWYLVFFFCCWPNFLAFCLCGKSFRWHSGHKHLLTFTIFSRSPALAISAILVETISSVLIYHPPSSPQSIALNLSTHHPLYISGCDTGTLGERSWWLTMLCHNDWKSTGELDWGLGKTEIFV